MTLLQDEAPSRSDPSRRAERRRAFRGRLDTDDARTVREERSSPGGEGAEGRPIGARFASDLAGAAWAAFMPALAEQGERLRRIITAAGYSPEQARLSRSDPSRRAKCRRAFRGAAHFEAAARDERAWIDAAASRTVGRA